jgi:hypothetical protein
MKAVAALLLVALVGGVIAWVVADRHAGKGPAIAKVVPDADLSPPGNDAAARSTAAEVNKPVEPSPAAEEPRTSTSPEGSPMPDETRGRTVDRRSAAPMPASAQRNVAPSQPAASPAPPSQDLLIPKPLARAALGFVGADPEAETVWALAINDPDRSPNERKDLIEDLNEDGFLDPKHVTADDLPLILSRLELIEELAPDSMDEVNAAAFAEAYKDLVNMLIKLGNQ